MFKPSLLLFFLLFTNGLIAQEDKEIFINDDIQLIHIQDSAYVHITWQESERYGRFSSNGLIIIKNGQAVMVDTPMDKIKTQQLVEFLKDSMQVELNKVIVCHFHNDCLGGLDYIHSLGIESVANSLTVNKCKELDITSPSTSFTDSLRFNFNGEQIVCIFPGGGHTFDNIVVWIFNKKILFGGCLIKASASKGLGNLADAIVKEWGASINRVNDLCKGIKTVIPGHGCYGGAELLEHTSKLVKNHVDS